ncbi:MAG: STAS domain-containing protein [Spirochaetota bacterium]
MNMKLNGEISVKNIEVFYNNLAKEMDNSREIVIDLSDVTRIDLAATQVIIAAGKKARELKKVVRLIGVNPQVKKLLTLAGIKA